MWEERCGSLSRKVYYVDKNTKQVAVVENATIKKFSFVRLFTEIFLPQGYPNSVTPDYLSYQIWDTIQALCSSITGVLSTRAILQGVGVGDETATVSGAVLQWLTRDGTGMIGRIVFTWYEGTELDSNAKTWRLMADILNDIGMFLEMISPIVPSLFLPLACMGTLCKSICGVCGGASRAALTQHFARRDNLADVSAKDNSQETASGLIGMFLGMFVTTILAKEKDASGGFLTWFLFIIFTIFHLFSNYRALRACTLQSINRQRANILLRHYIKNKDKILSPLEVSKMENILWWEPWNLPIVLGAQLHTLLQNEDIDDFERNKKTLQNERFMVDVKKGKILIALNKDANNKDCLKAYITAQYLRMLQSGELHSTNTRQPTKNQIEEANNFVNTKFSDFFERLQKQLWWVEKNMLGPTEERFSFVNNPPN